MTYNELLKKAERKAQKYKMEKTAVKSLLLFASNMEPSKLYLSLNEECPPETESKFKAYVDEYTINNRPVQYIIGYAYFYGYKILVNEGTLIPRWETEELTNNILIYYDRYFKGKKVKTLDLGTGSGAIAIALKKEEPNMDVYASDISEDAINEAKKSAKLNDCDIDFRVGSWFEPFSEDEKFDIIVSNPPYLTTTEYVEDIVKNNEPDVALYGGSDGLKFYRIILENARKYVNENKFIIGFEHGYDKKEELNFIIKTHFNDVKIVNLKDSMNRDRMTIIIKE
ncbi:peptide chain release factor N(5)-glutamine methyltransferase [bacterium]|nr:peptide chain release factor N(5)-glutamine methyltransferase [bacterium]